MLEIRELENDKRVLVNGERQLVFGQSSKIIGGQVGPATHIGCQNDQDDGTGQGTTYVSYAPDDVYENTRSKWDPFGWFDHQDTVDNPNDPDKAKGCPV